MKFKDYYAILGVARDATADDIRKRYRILARKYHPDVSKEPDAETRFKEMAEAYATLKDPEKRAAYDQLGTQRPGEEFRPPPEWSTQFGDAGSPFEEMDLADLFAGLASRGGHGGRRGSRGAMRGQDYEVTVPITLEEAYGGTEVSLDLATTEITEAGALRRVPKRVKARIPKGPTDGQVLRLPGQGGKGSNGGPDGDVYLNIALRPHRLYRVSGRDLYLDLPLAPWEAALGAAVVVPTLGGPVTLKVPPGTQGAARLRLAGRGLPKPDGGAGDLYAVAQIALPRSLTEREQHLFKELAAVSTFDPRQHFGQEARA
jgi:curved DNA-binding protein